MLTRISSNMVDIGAGRIALKDEGTGRRWTVDLNPFQIGKYVVTQQEYASLSAGNSVSAEQRDKPVVDVSWDEAVQFCNLLSERAGLKACYSLNSEGEVGCDWGLYDTIGNLWEWCWDIYDAEVYGAYRVFRGGGWNDPPRGCRASCRRKSHPSFGMDDLGFRLARSIV